MHDCRAADGPSAGTLLVLSDQVTLTRIQKKSSAVSLSGHMILHFSFVGTFLKPFSHRLPRRKAQVELLRRVGQGHKLSIMMVAIRKVSKFPAQFAPCESWIKGRKEFVACEYNDGGERAPLFPESSSAINGGLEKRLFLLRERAIQRGKNNRRARKLPRKSLHFSDILGLKWVMRFTLRKD